MADLILKEEKITQLNERVSETEYNILYPQTLAAAVTEDSEHKFVTEEQLELINNLGLYGLKFKGAYTASETYEKNDVVEHEGKYFICKANTITGTAPNESGDTEEWENINKEAYLANRADTVKLTNTDDSGTFKVVLALDEEYGSLYTDNEITYNAEDNVLETTVTKAQEADYATVADKYKKYTYATNDNGVVVSTPTEETPVISDALYSLEEQIKSISGGGTHLAEGIHIHDEEGTSLITDSTNQSMESFDGLKAGYVTIKQKYSTADITDLLETTKTKIDTKWLPDSIFGQLEYKGVWDPSTNSNKEAVKGYYYIANASGTINPDNSTSGIEYNVGDWAVYNGTSWDKVDNTDAVTMVNGQIGAVETYKGEWAEETQYFKGDWVAHGGVLYLAVTNSTGQAPDAEASTYWKVAGRIYKATDGIKLDGDTFKHDVAFEATTQAEDTLTAENNTFQVDLIVRDNFGHAKQLTQKTITLGDDFIDTVRPIQVNGTEILAKNVKDALNIVDGDCTTAENDGGSVKINHNTQDWATPPSFEWSDETSGAFSVPSFTVDKYGHITGGQLKTVNVSSILGHKHFDIKAGVIGAFEGITEDLDASLQPGSFYTGSYVPTSTEYEMKFKGSFHASKLLQSGNEVLDETLKIYTGIKYVPSTVIPGSLTPEPLIGEIKDGRIEIADSGIEEGVYSVVKVNQKGIATAGGQIIQFGKPEDNVPSDSLAVGGLFFRLIETV